MICEDFNVFEFCESLVFICVAEYNFCKWQVENLNFLSVTVSNSK